MKKKHGSSKNMGISPIIFVYSLYSTSAGKNYRHSKRCAWKIVSRVDGMKLLELHIEISELRSLGWLPKKKIQFNSMTDDRRS